MRIITPQDIGLIIHETDTYVITKSPYTALHIVSVKATGRDYGLATEKGARAFGNKRLWETADQARLERLKFAYPHLFEVAPAEAAD